MFLCNSILHKLEKHKQKMDYMNPGINKALHRPGIPLCSIASGELGRKPYDPVEYREN